VRVKNNGAIIHRESKTFSKKEGSHMIALLLGESLRITKKQPKHVDFIFLYSQRNISAEF
jgi:hypothetical protein